jgi:NAD+ synthase (glutamine-hydrolysing)
LADPGENAKLVLRLARDCHDESVALAVFPELKLSAYPIDILLQDTCSTGCGASSSPPVLWGD